jgi:hypothetical protein
VVTAGTGVQGACVRLHRAGVERQASAIRVPILEQRIVRTARVLHDPGDMKGARLPGRMACIALGAASSVMTVNMRWIPLTVLIATAACNAQPAMPTDSATPPNNPTQQTTTQQTTTGTSACASGQYYSGIDGSSGMSPGIACIGCHASAGGEAPLFTAAGTVYSGAHEPDNCYGTNVGASVVITDATGQTYTLPVNRAGNFFFAGSMPLPFTAKVTNGGNERAMVTPQMNGDCNSCHTQQGASGAPGRIMLP